MLVEMLATWSGRVFDPCCGSGGMFVQSLKFIGAHRTGNGGRKGTDYDELVDLFKPEAIRKRKMTWVEDKPDGLVAQAEAS